MRGEELNVTVIDIVSREIGTPADRIGMDTTLVMLDIDSLDILRLAETFERTFKITIGTAELTQIKTIGDIVAGLERKLTG